MLNNSTDIINITEKYNFKEYNLLKNIKLYKNKHNYFIIDTINLQILNYMFENDIYNFKGYNYMIQNINFINTNSTILEYIEGIKIMILFSNNKWYLVQKCKILEESSLIYKFFFSQIEDDIKNLIQTLFTTLCIWIVQQTKL